MEIIGLQEFSPFEDKQNYIRSTFLDCVSFDKYILSTM